MRRVGKEKRDVDLELPDESITSAARAMSQNEIQAILDDVHSKRSRGDALDFIGSDRGLSALNEHIFHSPTPPRGLCRGFAPHSVPAGALGNSCGMLLRDTALGLAEERGEKTTTLHSQWQLPQSSVAEVVREVIRSRIMAGRRPDHRGCDDVRAISCATNVYESLHGAALFSRGETQVGWGID